jgi:hypothetical protein
MRTFNRMALATAAAAVCASSALAAVGDTYTYSFNAQSQGNATPTTTVATLTLLETLLGVDLTLTPNWSSGANRVDQLSFVYSGDAYTFVDSLAGPATSLATSADKTIDSGYVSSAYVMTASWGSSPAARFDSATAAKTWSVNSTGSSVITLEDFTQTATAVSTKPSPAFGVISMPGINLPGDAGSNWVAEGFVDPIPEPETYALMGVGLAVLAWATRRQRRQTGKRVPQTA